MPACKVVSVTADLYPDENFTQAERDLLAGRFTSVDGPVFALTNLPEAVKGALFARYSRYPGTLRRLYLDEFADTLPAAAGDDTEEGSRARDIYDRVFVGFGDDSVAQLGGVHLACEWTSNILTKLLQRPRIGAAYLEQSTRYIAFDTPVAGTGRYRYFRHPALGPEYEAAMDGLFDTYADLLERMTAWTAERYPAGPGDSEAAWRRAVRAKALDACRGLLPAASLSHMGIYATGQTYEQLLLHLLAHPLPEARDYGQRMLSELQKVIPSFLARVERPDRGGMWMSYLEGRASRAQTIAERIGLRGRKLADHGPEVRLLVHRGEEDDILTALLFEASTASEADAGAVIHNLSAAESRALLAELLGNREHNRRHRPGRGLEAVSYRFEIVSDYGAFRDLQRHRMLTVQWQQLSPDLGAEVPEDIDSAGLGGEFRAALERSQAEYERLRAAGLDAAAPYALCLAYRLRYILDLNAREAMQLIELRSGREGHPSYRAVALAMHRAIAGVHPTVAAAMTHVDTFTDARLERMDAELRTERRMGATTRH